MTTPITNSNGYPDIPMIFIEEALSFPVPDNIDEGEEIEDLFPLELNLDAVTDEQSEDTSKRTG